MGVPDPCTFSHLLVSSLWHLFFKATFYFLYKDRPVQTTSCSDFLPFFFCSVFWEVSARASPSTSIDFFFILEIIFFNYQEIPFSVIPPFHSSLHCSLFYGFNIFSYFSEDIKKKFSSSFLSPELYVFTGAGCSAYSSWFFSFVQIYSLKYLLILFLPDIICEWRSGWFI